MILSIAHGSLYADGLFFSFVGAASNHDVPLYRVWERWLQPRRSYSEQFGTPQPAVYEYAGTRIVTLDSTDPYVRFSGGRVTRRQLVRCVELLNQPGESRHRVLVLHHNLVSPPGTGTHKPIADAQHVLDQLAQAHVDVVLSGHLHHAFVVNTLDIYPGANRSRGTLVCNCGTTTARRGRSYEREKNSFNLLSFESTGAITVEHWVYFSADAAFSCVSQHTFFR